MTGGWDVVEQPDWSPSAEPPRTQPGWEVVVREEPAATIRRPWLPSARTIEVALGSVIHVSVGLLLALAVLKLLIELAG